jgi:hypothetical protein
MKYLSAFILFMTAGILYPRENTSTYQVNSIQEALAITGKGDNPLWEHAAELSDFSYPWESEQPSPTTFRALHSEHWVYCLFTVHDDHVKIYADKHDKKEVVWSDRAEIFFRKDDQLSPYYCLELDPSGRILDYKGELYRKFDFQWSWPAGGLIVKTHLEAHGYTVEVAISKQSLVSLGLLKDSMLQAGLYRADCVELKGKDATFKWISWIRPDSKTPDFHIASSFGTLVLEKTL